jgi:hypothetical protein
VNSYEDLAGDGRLLNVSDLVIHFSAEVAGNAGLLATSADFATFIEALFDARLVGPSRLAEMLKHTHCDCYGLGLHFFETPFGMAIGHSGGDLGVQSWVRRFPDLEATLVLLANAGDGGAMGNLFTSLREEIMEAALDDL